MAWVAGLGGTVEALPLARVRPEQPGTARAGPRSAEGSGVAERRGEPTCF